MSLENLSSTAFYLPEADGSFTATPATAGPWSPQLQHAGPPAALAARAIAALPAAPGLRVARLTVDILRPVPVAPLRVEARVVRPGRRVDFAEATVAVAGDDDAAGPALRVAAWRVAAAPAGAPATTAPRAVPPLPGPQPQPHASGVAHLDGYMRAVEWRFVSGSFDEAGPATAWARPRLPLVAGEEMSPLQRALLLADSGNGVGTSVDRSRWLSINTDLAVSLHRDPVGEWVCLASSTTIAPGTTGATTTDLLDPTGLVGTATQTLLVDTLAA